MAARLGVSTHSLYAWIKRYSKPQAERQQDDYQHAELRRLRAELKRVTEERDMSSPEIGLHLFQSQNALCTASGVLYFRDWCGRSPL